MTTLLTLLGGCSNGRPDQASSSSRIAASEARALEQQVLDERARAVRRGDLRLFLRRVDRADRSLVARQRRYFANLTRLPMQTFRYQVRAEQWQGQRILGRWGRDVRIPQVTMSVQLRGYDEVPVKRVVGFVFSFDGGKARIVSDRSADGKALYDGTPQPWDLTSITTLERSGVLGVFDRTTSASAAALVGSVADGVERLSARLPFSWSRRVVVYSTSDKAVLGSFTDIPGGSLDHLGALTFPTYAGTSPRSEIASTRMLVMPSSVRAGQPFLGRITRHELSHAAIGERDDGSPTWVSEGIAEYLGAREVPLRQRIIATEARSRAGSPVDGLPASSDFNRTDQEWHYALSWMAVDYVAATFGEARVWELMSAMRNGGSGTPDAEQDRVLGQVLGMSGQQLAERAAARIREIYG